MSKSNIEWTQETWNPITGCTKYSEGCKNCYAEKMTKRLKAMRQKKYAEGFDKVVFHPKEQWRAFGKKPKMIFVNSMSDTFHKDILHWQVETILGVCLYNNIHTFQILTKRSERLKEFSYPKNVWLGVTVEHSDYKFRIDDLKQTNASVKFLSCEPLLSDLGELDLSGIDWVICGGESGPNARPCHPDWVRNIQRQCQEQNVPFFFKQWGEYIHCSQTEELKAPICIIKPTCLGPTEFGTLNFSDFWYKVGKKKSGCLLDGKEYKEFPKVVQNG